jgi:hypothetical protein
MALFSKLPPYIGVKISHFFWQAWKADALPLGDARASGAILSHRGTDLARM